MCRLIEPWLLIGTRDYSSMLEDLVFIVFDFWVANYKPGPMFCSDRGKKGESCSHWEGFFCVWVLSSVWQFSPKDWVIVTHCYQPVINTGWWALCFPLPKAEQKSAGSDTSLGVLSACGVNVVITRDYCCFSGWTIVTGILTRQRNELLSNDLSCLYILFNCRTSGIPLI